MKQSRIKRLISKKLARQIAQASRSRRAALEALAKRESAKSIAQMERKGFSLVTRLETGEGVFVRDEKVVGLHIQLPADLYTRLHEESKARDTTKRQLVIDALERHLGPHR